MQIVNMDVERQGSRGAFSLGPFSPGLNAVCGPAGSGKTSLLYWLRQLALGDRAGNTSGAAPTWSHVASPLRGSVELHNRGLRFRLGATSPEAGNRDAGYSATSTFATAHRSYDPAVSPSSPGLSAYPNLTAAQRDAFASFATSAGADDTVDGLESVAHRLGLYETPSHSSATAPHALQRDRWLARQHDVDVRLAQIQHLPTSRATLLARRDDLQRELQAVRAPSSEFSLGRSGSRHGDLAVEDRRYRDRCAVIEDDLRGTEAHLAELERELASLNAELKLLEMSRHAVSVDDSYRVQLQQIDERLTRWRQTLRDLKGHRSQIENEAINARLDRQVGDQLSVTKEPDPRAPLRSLEAQILSARTQLDALVKRHSLFQDRVLGDRVLGDRALGDRALGDRHHSERGDSAGQPADYQVRRDAYGRTHIAYRDEPYYLDSDNLPETLRSMQKDLYEACQQLARHESRTANETLKQQSQQLQRCETELLQSVEKLIEERAVLLRKIADQYQLSAEQLSLAFGDWCNCQDHNHLHDWLLSDAQVQTVHTGIDQAARQRLLDAIDDVQNKRERAARHAEDCRRQLREAELQQRDLISRRTEPLGRRSEDIRRDLDDALLQLDQWEERERLNKEAHELRQLLSTERNVPATSDRFSELVNRQIAALMGGRERFKSLASFRNVPEDLQRRYDLVDGIVYEPERRYEAEVPTELVRVAQRLAIAEAMAARNEPIPVLIDEELDRLNHEDQAAAIAHLARVATTGQQLIVMTGDQRVAELIRQHRGWVGYLNANAAPVLDINRHLAAVANDYESSKWYQPSIYAEQIQSGSPKSQFFLTQRSRVEESPSIDGPLASRLRGLGIDRIGDLLDADPAWVADQIGQSGISENTVASWQAEALLLCSIRQLRPFDARLLVSIGVRSPQQLAQMHPSQLLDRVERFVATDMGRRLLRSGSSYELSRITTWIASAKGGSARHHDSSFSDRATHRNGFAGQRQSARGSSQRDDFGGEYDSAWQHSPDERERQLAPGEYYEDEVDSDRDSRPERDPRRSTSRERDSRASSRSSGRRSSQDSSRDYPTLRRSGRSAEGESQSTTARRERPDRKSRQPDNRPRRPEAIKLADAQFPQAEMSRLKFYLELASPVVDAPSIGPRMSARLEAYGIETIDQLLAANADSLADKLNMRRVDAATIVAWQDQARLVCRIPNLRGHDAQLLVACNLTSPEELAAMPAASVLAQVLVVAESAEGQRILRGSKNPDLAEVNDWIRWAGQCRSLNAA